MLCRWIGPGDRLFPYMEVGDMFMPCMKVTFHLAFDDGKNQRSGVLVVFYVLWVNDVIILLR